MNPWARLIDPAAPVPQPAVPSRKHVAADDLDPVTQQPASKPRPYVPQNVREPAKMAGPAKITYESQGVCTVRLPAGSMLAEAFFPKIGHGARVKIDEKIAQSDAPAPPVPRKLPPPVAPCPVAYRVPAPPPRPAMTYAEAIAIRERARNKQPVERALLLEANILVQETRRRAMPPGESYR